MKKSQMLIFIIKKKQKKKNIKIPLSRASLGSMSVMLYSRNVEFSCSWVGVGIANFKYSTLYDIAFFTIE